MAGEPPPALPPLLDCHCHAWRIWPYAPLVPDERTRGTVEQLLYEMDAHGVEQAVLVCARIENNPDNIEYATFAHERHPDRLHVLADIDCTWSATYHTGGSAGRLRTLADRYDLAGFTHYTRVDNDGWLRSEDAEELFGVASERRMLVSLGASPAWHADLRALARRHPDVPILCHTLGGIRSGQELDPASLNEVLESAEVPNIHLKAAGLHYCSPRGWDYPWPDVLAVLEQLVAAYGAERLCWGSDFPAGTRFCTYRQSLEAIRTHAGFLDARELGLVLGGNLQRLLNGPSAG
jgi:L-fuconolactonase